jgi:hypothetical protein
MSVKAEDKLKDKKEIVMSEEIKNEEVIEIKKDIPEIKDGAVVESTPEESDTKVVQADETEDSNQSIFITEDDTFDIEIKWYKKDKQLYIDGISDNYDAKDNKENCFTITFKYPSQGDAQLIMGGLSYKKSDDISMSDLVQMELFRLSVLCRRWTLKQDVDQMINLDPYIVKSIVHKVRDEIGMKGII